MSLSQVCPSPEVLSAYADRACPAEEAARVEAHAALCLPCQGILRTLVEDRNEAPVASLPGRFRLRAAAAALLLASGAGWFLLGPGRPGGSPGADRPARPLSRDFPRGRLASSCLIPGADLVLEPSARVESRGRSLSAGEGRFWLDVSGEPVTVELASLKFRVSEGALAVECRPAARPAASLLFREALAEEPGKGASVRIWVLRGVAEATCEGRSLRLVEGRKLEFSAGGWIEGSLSSAEADEARRARLAAVQASPGRGLLSPGTRLSRAGPDAAASGSPSPSWRWVTVLAGRHPMTEMGFTLDVEGRGYQWVPGLASASPAPREVVEFSWDGERLLGRVDGVLRLSVPRGRLGEVLRAVPGSGWRISAWEGEVTVVSSILAADPR